MIKKNDWKTAPLPKDIEYLGYQNFFWDSDAEKIMCGHKPSDMNDEWFIYSENGWVYFVRSRSGHYVYAIQLTGTPAGGAKVISSWVNSNPDQYRSPGKEKDIQIINHLIKSRFGVEGNA